MSRTFSTQLNVIVPIITIVFGILYIFITPPFQTPDEPQHLYRSYQIAQGDIIGEKRGNQSGGVIPVSLVYTVAQIADSIAYHPERKQNTAKIKEAFSYQLLSTDTIFHNFSNTVIHSPLPYLPQVIGISIGKILSLPPIYLLYLSRIMNLLFAVLAITYVMRILPLFQKAAALVMLTPMSIFLIASCSSDVSTNCYAFIFTALCFRLAYNDTHMLKLSSVMMLCIVSAALGFCKSVYFPLTFLYFFIPVRKARSHIEYFVIGILIVFIGFIASLIWSSIAKQLYSPYLPGFWATLDEPIAYIMAHPSDFAQIMIRDIIRHGTYYVGSFIGYLGWLDIKLSDGFRAFYWLVIIGVAITEYHPTCKVTILQKALSIMVVCQVIMLIMLSQFVIWTKNISQVPGQYILEYIGAQGRYFLPLGIVGLLPLANQRWGQQTLLQNISMFMTIILIIIALLYGLVAIILRYYY